MTDERFYIIKNGYWYRPDACGYTKDIDKAGLFTLDEAIQHTYPNGPYGPRDGLTYYPMSEFKTTAKPFSKLVLEELANMLNEAEGIISKLVDDDPCVKDHHGYCQTHFLEDNCSNAAALAWLEVKKNLL